MTERQAELIELIHKEVKPALGCTEPIAVALAVAKAVDIISENCSHCGDCPLWRQTADFRITVEVSGNILKNGMGVGIPGTGMVGLPIAAALGAVCGDPALGLEVLHGACRWGMAWKHRRKSIPMRTPSSKTTTTRSWRRASRTAS